MENEIRRTCHNCKHGTDKKGQTCPGCSSLTIRERWEAEADDLLIWARETHALLEELEASGSEIAARAGVCARNIEGQIRDREAAKE